jgi:hypothetical protein
MSADPCEAAYAEILQLFFGSLGEMQRSLTILCESNQKSTPPTGTDTVTQTVLMLLSSPLHIQLTVVGWQPLKGRDLTFPYALMSLEQRQGLRRLVDEGGDRWSVYEHAMMFRRGASPMLLKSLDVLEALCSLVLSSATAYPDKRLRVAICNILLQRVQANIPIERNVQAALNAKLFPPLPSGANVPGTPRAAESGAQ